MSSTVRSAIVGGGWVSLNRHLPSALAHPDVEVVGFVAPESHLSALRENVNLPGARYDSSLDAPWLDQVDAVIIGTPPVTHHDLALAALERGKHVLIEKPFAMDAAQAERMNEAAASRGRIIAVVHNLQFARAASRARSVVESGAVGDVTAVMGFQSSNHRRRLPTWYPDLPLGLFTDESPHLIYMLLGYLGGASLETAHVGAPWTPHDNTPDLVSLQFRGETGVVGSLQMTFVGAISEWLLVVLASEGTVVVDFFRDTTFTLRNDRSHGTTDVLRTTERSILGHLAGTVRSGILRVRGRLDYGNDEVMRRFVDAVHTGVPPDRMSGRDGARVVEVLDAANAARAGRGGDA